MKQSVDIVITNLRNFTPQNDADSGDLYELIASLEVTENSNLAIPVMFELMEKYPEADLGSPGALVHFIESVGGYELQLIQSVERVPMYLNVWMINRLLNSSISEDKTEQFLKLLEAVSCNPNATITAKESAINFLEYQQSRKKYL